MKTPPIPVVFQPIFKAKPWGGRRLATRLGKPLPGQEPVGESWEVASLPGSESRVRGGPFSGRTLHELVATWGDDLLGGAPLADGRFPLLIKFLDASEHLSVQVHPKPGGAAWQPGIKHEAWYVIAAEREARLFIGLRPGVTAADLERVANTPAMVDVLRVWEGRPGECYYLPSGTLHALGAGLLVAEVQTPSDVTYRAYDWERVGLDGKPRELHVAESLANIRYDVTAAMIRPPERTVAHPFGTARRVATCDAFVMDLMECAGGFAEMLQDGPMRIWMILAGGGRLRRGNVSCPIELGDVVLVPAAARGIEVEFTADTKWIDVTIPRAAE